MQDHVQIQGDYLLKERWIRALQLCNKNKPLLACHSQPIGRPANPPKDANNPSCIRTKGCSYAP